MGQSFPQVRVILVWVDELEASGGSDPLQGGWMRMKPGLARPGSFFLLSSFLCVPQCLWKYYPSLYLPWLGNIWLSLPYRLELLRTLGHVCDILSCNFIILCSFISFIMWYVNNLRNHKRKDTLKKLTKLHNIVKWKAKSVCVKWVGRETYLTTKEKLHSAAVIWDGYDRPALILAGVLRGEGIGNLLMLGTLNI